MPVLTGALWTPTVLQGPWCPNCRMGGTTLAHRLSREGLETQEEDRRKVCRGQDTGTGAGALSTAQGHRGSRAVIPEHLLQCPPVESATQAAWTLLLLCPLLSSAVTLPVPTRPCHPLCCRMPGCLDPCMGQALGGVPPSLLLVQLQGHLCQESSAPSPICQSLREHDFPLPSASATPHTSTSRLPDGCPGHGAQAPLSAPLQCPRGPARWQRSWVCPVRQLTSPGTSRSAMVTVSGHAHIQLSTMSWNRMKHALGTLEPSPHLGLWVWGATRGCAAYSCICVGPWATIGR